MSETEKNKTSPELAAEPAKKKRGKKLLLIILVVFLSAGAAGYIYLRGFTIPSFGGKNEQTADKDSKKSDTKKASEDADEEEEEEKKSSKSASTASLENALTDDEDVKHIVELQPFIVNLADEDQARYLRMTVSLGIGGEGGEAEKPDQIFISRVRNAMLAVLSVKTSEDVLSVKGKAKLRRELLKAAKAASETPEVHAIYITDFIVQL